MKLIEDIFQRITKRHDVSGNLYLDIKDLAFNQNHPENGAAFNKFLISNPHLLGFAQFIDKGISIVDRSTLDEIASSANRFGQYSRPVSNILETVMDEEAIRDFDLPDQLAIRKIEDREAFYSFVLTWYMTYLKSKKMPVPPELQIDQKNTGTTLQTLAELISLACTR